MDIFRNAFNSWTRRDPQTSSNPPSPEMPRCHSTPTSTPTPADPNPNPIPPSSPLSSLHTTVSSAAATVASPNDTPKGGGEEEEEEEEAAQQAQETVLTDDDGDHERPQYHTARGLPPELKEHCRVYLEEALRMSLIS